MCFIGNCIFSAVVVVATAIGAIYMYVIPFNRKCMVAFSWLLWLLVLACALMYLQLFMFCYSVDVAGGVADADAVWVVSGFDFMMVR